MSRAPRRCSTHTSFGNPAIPPMWRDRRLCAPALLPVCPERTTVQARDFMNTPDLSRLSLRQIGHESLASYTYPACAHTSRLQIHALGGAMGTVCSPGLEGSKTAVVMGPSPVMLMLRIYS